MSSCDSKIRVAVISVVKHAYVPLGIASHDRYEIVVVADDASEPDWVHERNQKFADQFDVPYLRDVEKALSEYGAQVAVVSSQAERHCDLSVRAANAGLHVVQDKPMSTVGSECDRVVEAVEKAGVKFLLWNRNYLPAVQRAAQAVQSGDIGELRAIHVDFYFAKDAGPPIGSRQEGEPPLDWLEAQIAAHVTGADGGVGERAMGELEIEGIYPLGYIHLLTGARVKRVFARTASHFHQLNADNDVEDLATVSLEMDGGIVGGLCIGRIGNASHPDIGEIKLHVIGTKGSLVISEARPEVSVDYRDRPGLVFRNERVANDNDWLLADDLVRAIDEDGETMMDATLSRHIQATVEAAIESAKTGAAVEVG